MDSGLIIKPVARVTRTKAGYRTPRDATATELDPADCVTAAVDAVPAPRYQLARDAMAQHHSGREAAIAPQTREALYRACDVRSDRGPPEVQEIARKVEAYARTGADPEPDAPLVERRA